MTREGKNSWVLSMQKVLLQEVHEAEHGALCGNKA